MYKILLKVTALIAVLVLIDVAVCLVYPDVSAYRKANPRKTAMMEYREREYEKAGKKIRLVQTWVPLSRISPYMTKAVLIAEDDKFWHHDGFDYDGIEHALEKDIRDGKFKAGGSTISQQLAKNLWLSPSRNPVRKIKEAVLTLRMERSLSKRRILEIYLNVAEWGDGIFGIEAAARHWFGVSAVGLSADQSAKLASVLPNPRKYSPVNPSRYVTNRSRIIYGIMVRRGIVLPDFDEVMKPEPSGGAAGGPAPPGGMSNYSGAAGSPPSPVASTMGAFTSAGHGRLLGR